MMRSVPPQQALRDGAEHFDARRFWEAHEAWEHLWRQEVGSERHYLKGLIQIAAACHHVQRGVPAGAVALLERAAQHLAAHGHGRWPFDTGHLLASAASMARSLERGRMPRLPPVRLMAMIEAWEEPAPGAPASAGPRTRPPLPSAG